MDLDAVLLCVGVAGIVAATFMYMGIRTWKEVRAAQRAERVVLQFLTPDEIVQLDKDGYLSVPSRNTPGRVYRIPAQPGRVTVVESGKPRSWLCLQPTCWLPDREHVLVHKLLLEGAESEYWERANHLNGRLQSVDSLYPVLQTWPNYPGDRFTR